MKASFYIAARYFFSKKKKKNVVHVISIISLIGICIGTMALVIVLSVYNGFGKLIEELTGVFDPAILIEPKEGKTFHLTNFPVEEIKKIDGVEILASSVEENAWVAYRNKETIITLKGVSENYHHLNRIDSLITKGNYLLSDDVNDFAIVGYGIFYDLGISLRDFNHYIRVNIPKRKKSISLNLKENFNTGYLFPMGAFQTNDQPDQEYILTNIDFARGLLNYADDEVTSVELGLTKNANISKVQKKIKALVGENYSIKNRHEQQELFHKIYRSEKIMIYLILLFIIFIATFNLIGSIYLLIIDKKKDISILKSMGMPFKDIRNIFFIEGNIVASVGIIFGIILGIIICTLQQYFGIIKVEGFVMDAFPVSIQLLDILIITFLVFLICSFSIALTVLRMKEEK